MKAYKSVLFMLSVLAILALVSAVFPTEGIKAGPINLEFPTLMEILSTNDTPEEPQLSPEELLQIRLQVLVAARDNEFLSFCEKDASRFYLPNNDLTYFDDFFIRLDNCKREVVRIVHYGDSQIEEDRMSGYLRERFQSSYGGSGVGMLPAVPKSVTHTISEHIIPEETPYYIAYGTADARANHRRYGPMAQVAHIDTVTTISFRTREAETYPHCQTFSRVKVRLQGSGSLSFSASGIRVNLTCTDTISNGPKVFVADLPKPVSSGTLVLSGVMDIYAIQLDGSSGVVVDNVPMRGCSGTMFTNIDRQSIASFYKDENVGLIILQYGGNSVPYLKNEKSIQKFCEDTKRQIDFFHQIAPTAKILYIGPSDMSTSIGGQMQTYTHLPEVVSALQQAVNEAGAAYWNMFEAMGGKGSMVQWVKSRPQLAGEDYIHFTPKGAQRISEILYGAFDIYYKYYRFRNYDRFSMGDSISLDSDTL